MSFHSFFRVISFWVLLAISFGLFAFLIPFSNAALIVAVASEIAKGNIDRVSDQHFAFAVASLIAQVAASLATTLLFTHVIAVRLSLRAARRVVERASDHAALSAQFDTISERLRKNYFVGDALGEFTETTVRSEGVIQNTTRPQSFINFGELRDRLFALKMMPAMPGYFVGLGLLLTFIGLVIALNKAAGAATANDPKAMTAALNQLLQAATFKFSTSIAGLGASLVLSIIFRMYQISIESGIYRFCHALERRMSFHPAQKLAIETRDLLAEQRDELKQINSEQFFNRLGETVSPGFQAALAPVAEALKQSLDRVEQSSQGRLEDMLGKFVDSLNQGAGSELTGVADSLRTAKSGLDGIEQVLSATGGEFAERLGAASETLRAVVDQASRTAQAFGKVAGDVQAATEPLLAQGERVMNATESMARSVETSVTVLSGTEGAARLVSEALQSHLGELDAVWKAYESRFSQVDDDFSAAAERFHAEVTRHQEAIRDFVVAIDEHTASVLTKLASGVNSLDGNVEELAESVDELKEALAGASQR